MAKLMFDLFDQTFRLRLPGGDTGAMIDLSIDAFATTLPLTGALSIDRPEMLGGRTRAALERDKALVLRAIKELEFDRGMGKVSEKDFAEMSARLRLRAGRIMRDLEAGSLYRAQIEREVAQRLAKSRSRIRFIRVSDTMTPPTGAIAPPIKSTIGWGMPVCRISTAAV